MAELETSSPAANYVSRSNIVVPRPEAGGLQAVDVAARAKTDIEGRLGLGDTALPAAGEAPLQGKTLSAVSTPKQETS
jgi:hypothetical protein